eukprot:TRINITY_DN9427_c0_g1_i1.p1 TRINITY_DN9427_c0_g1~~TRINITY_DN9427_c0_g1_i1.p1  ORF type:complete len:120 (+),score=19.95 TRINITY_DN9427_c0_g1_i1:825-1184(+)
MGCRPSKMRKSVMLVPPSLGVLKFNVDGAARGKPRPAGIGGVLRNSKGEVLFTFSKPIGIRDSKEAEVLAILKALCYFSRFFHGNLIVESDSSNVVAWVSNRKTNPWKLQFIFDKIQVL